MALGRLGVALGNLGVALRKFRSSRNSQLMRDLNIRCGAKDFRFDANIR